MEGALGGSMQTMDSGMGPLIRKLTRPAELELISFGAISPIELFHRWTYDVASMTPK